VFFFFRLSHAQTSNSYSTLTRLNVPIGQVNVRFFNIKSAVLPSYLFKIVGGGVGTPVGMTNLAPTSTRLSEHYFEWMNGEQLRAVPSDLTLPVNRCIDVERGENLIKYYDCGDLSNQNQRFVKVSGSGGSMIQWAASSGESPKCIGWSASSPDQLLLSACDPNNPYQLFNLPDAPVFNIVSPGSPQRQLGQQDPRIANGLYFGFYNQPINPALNNGKFEWYLGQNIRWVGTTKCLDVSNGNNVNGNRVSDYDCSVGLNQLFFKLPNNSLKWKGMDKCLEPQDNTDGAALQIWQCNQQPKQNFNPIPSPDVFGIRMTATGNDARVLTVTGTNDGASVISASPNGLVPGVDIGDFQTFQWVNGAQLRSIGGNTCLGVEWGTNQNGQAVGSFGCTDPSLPLSYGRANQMFVKDGDDRIRWVGTDKCLTVKDGRLIILTCDPTENGQKFSFAYYSANDEFLLQWTIDLRKVIGNAAGSAQISPYLIGAQPYNQYKFVWAGGDHIANLYGGAPLCLQVNGEPFASIGQVINFSPCVFDSSDPLLKHQQWIRRGSTMLQLKVLNQWNTPQCLTITDTAYTGGLTIWDCNENDPKQHFNFVSTNNIPII